MALRETVEDVRRDGAGSTTPSILVKAVLPILRDLGWTDQSQINLDLAGVDVALLAPASGGGRATGQSFVLVKIEPSGVPSQRAITRTLESANRHGAAFFAITTGLAWWLYLARPAGDDAGALFAAADVRDDSAGDVANTLAHYLAKSAVTSESARRRAEEALKARRDNDRLRLAISQAWRRLVAAPEGTLLVDLVREEVKNTVGLDSSDEQITAVIKRTVVPDAPADTATQASASDIAVAESEMKRRRPTGYQLWGEHHRIQRQREILTGVAEAIHQRHPDTFDRVLRVSQQFTTDPTTRKVPIPIGSSSYYHEGGLNRQVMERLSTKLLRAFGYSEDDLVILHSTPIDWETRTPPGIKRGPRRRRRRASHPPTGVNLWGTHYPTKWQYEALTILATRLYERHADRFDLALRSTQITKDPSTRTVAVPIGATGYFHEKAIGSGRLRSICDKLLEIFGYPPEDLEFTYE